MLTLTDIWINFHAFIRIWTIFIMSFLVILSQLKLRLDLTLFPPIKVHPTFTLSVSLWPSKLVSWFGRQFRLRSTVRVGQKGLKSPFKYKHNIKVSCTQIKKLHCVANAGVTFANLLHIFFYFYTANTKNINVTML